MDQAGRPSALLGRLRRSTPLVTGAVVASVVTGLVVTGAIIVQAVALSSMLAALFHHAHAALGRDVIRFAGATLVRSLANGLSEPVTSRIAAPLRRHLRARTLTLVLDRGPFGSPDATVQLATRGIDAIENYLAHYVPALVLATLAPMVLLGWLATHDALSALIVLVSVLLLPIFMVLLGLEARGKMQERWSEQQRLAGYYGDVVRGMTVLKSFNRSKDAVANLDAAGVALRQSTMATLRVAFLSGFALELLSSLATALVALVLGLRLLNGSLGLGVALAVLLLTPEVFLPLRRSAAQYHASSEGIAAANDLMTRLESAPAPGDAAVPAAFSTIEFEGLVLGADRQRTARDAPLDLTIEAGSLVLVTGPSGVGKTTLLRTIAGLRGPAAGRVLVDGVDLARLSRDQWRRQVGWLPQDPVLPGRDVRDVVRLGDSDISDATIRAALDQLELDLDLDRPLGDGSAELSAGERRRLALVRCLVRGPQLLLLDEPTAHLDPRSSDLVVRAIASLALTRIVATHQPFTADRVIELSPVRRRG